MFEMAPSIGTRQYDWPNKIQVALSPIELSQIVTDPDSDSGHNFYHDTCEARPHHSSTLPQPYHRTPTDV